jgi:hypothetical protein
VAQLEFLCEFSETIDYGAQGTVFLTAHEVKENLQTEFFCGLECVGHSFADVAHFVFLRDVYIRTQRAV